ncbi:MAG: lipoprotein-releasing ABC transporter permease subunit [bacterium]
MSYELFIANRYLKSKRKTGFISLITYISILGVMIGVAALIIVLSIMNGFESEVRSRIIGFGAHIELRTFHNQGVENHAAILGKIDHVDHISGISPYIEEKALIISKNKSGLAVKGVDLETLGRVSDIQENVNYGMFELGTIKSDGQKSYPGIVLGTYLADRLNVDIGDKVQIMSPTNIGPLLLNSMPNLRTFRVSGFFETGIYEFDDLFAYISLKEAQRLFDMKKKVTGLEIKLDDLNYADEVSARIDNILGYPYTTVTWFEMNKNLFSWMQIEKWGMFIILSLIIMVAAFNIVSTLIMMVLEKTREIGILKSMGATSSGIMKIFILEGLIGGVIGTVIGCLLGYVLCWLQLKYELVSLPADVYIISALPVQMKGLDFFLIALVAILLCYGAAVYPALRASKLEPVEAIRYE